MSDPSPDLLCERAVPFLLEQIGRSRASPPVFHYTTAKGLIGLAASHTIFATDIRYLNDSQEFQYGLEIIKNQLGIRRGTSSRPDEEMQLFVELEGALGIVNAFDTFVACFSAVPDLLSQWRAYTRPTGGFAIGFDSDDLRRATRCELVPCVYNRGRQAELAQHLLEFVFGHYHRAPKPNGHAEDIVRNSCGSQFFEGVLFLAAAFKSPGFFEEHESRLILPRFQGDGDPIKFREAGGRVVPYVELPLIDDGTPIRASRLVVGPSPNAALDKIAAAALLRRNGFKVGEVEISAIPYRAQ